MEVQLHATIDLDTHRQLKQASALLDIPIKDCVNTAILFWLKNQKYPADKKLGVLSKHTGEKK